MMSSVTAATATRVVARDIGGMVTTAIYIRAKALPQIRERAMRRTKSRVPGVGVMDST